MAKQKQNTSVEAEVLKLQKEIFEMRNELAVNRKIDKPHLIRAKRKEIARLYTRQSQERQED